jgi:hypothetical protein
LPDPYRIVAYGSFVPLLLLLLLLQDVMSGLAEATGGRDPDLARWTPWNWVIVGVGGSLLLSLLGALFLADLA